MEISRAIPKDFALGMTNKCSDCGAIIYLRTWFSRLLCYSIRAELVAGYPVILFLAHLSQVSL